MKEAMLYESGSEGRVRCNLCAHRCTIAQGKRGICQVRENRDGRLYTLVYGRVIAQHIDPVEKKPLFHFHPGSTAYSIATPGCNFRCKWCQNADISQEADKWNFEAGEQVPPQDVVKAARRSGCRSIAYTYTEPTIFFEYAYDTARLAHEADLANIFVTNGYMTIDMLDTFHPYLDAANVDLKAFRQETYRTYVGASLQPVLDSMKKMKALGIWLEVTTLIIPEINDDPAELRDAARFVAQELGSETPWHLSRFFPAYQMRDTSPAPLETLRRAEEIGREEGLYYIYMGNVSGEVSTHCHECGRLLIRRSAYGIQTHDVDTKGRCPECHTLVAGVGMGAG